MHIGISFTSLEEFSPEMFLARRLQEGPGKRHLEGQKMLHESCCYKRGMVETAVDYCKNYMHLKGSLIYYSLNIFQTLLGSY